MNWISVDERLPDKNSEVLVYADGEILMARYLWSKAYNYKGQTWLCSYSHSDLENDVRVIAYWHPLPDPPADVKVGKSVV